MYFEFQGRQHGATWVPAVDVFERENEIVIFVEMPGVEKSDVQLSWNNGVLIIAGHKRQRLAAPGTAHFLCVERTYGQFRREIEINVSIDRREAKAELNDGLLKIRLPKTASRSEPSNIPII